MDERTILVTLPDGREVEGEILLTFDDEKKKRSYVLFVDKKSEEGEVYAMRYDDKGNLFFPEDEEEWNMCEEMLEGYIDAEEEED